jgi:hypothetical protein
MSKLYIYIGVVSNINNLLIIDVVDFVPHKNINNLGIKGHNGSVKLLYQAEFSNFPTPFIDETSPLKKLNYSLNKFKSPLGNSLYSIELENAIAIINSPFNKVEFYKGKRISNLQIKEIESLQEESISRVNNAKIFSKNLDKEINDIENLWKSVLLKFDYQHKQWIKSNYHKKWGFFDSLIKGPSFYNFLLDQEIKKNITAIYDLNLKDHIEIICKTRPIDEIEDLLLNSTDKNESSCDGLVSLNFSFIDDIDGKLISDLLTGKCKVCGRSHDINIDPIQFNYFRPRYLDESLVSFFNLRF